MFIRFETIKENEAIKAYIRKADESLIALGYTEHSFAHVTRVANTAGNILATLGYSERDIELAKIAAYLHDIGNLVNRTDHAQSGAVMAFRILDHLGGSPEEGRFLVVSSPSAGIESPEDLIGKKVMVVCNLAPRKIRGVVSEGMILSADMGDAAKVVFVDDAVPEGSRVR